MAASSTVSAGDDILASQYNNLRTDVLDTTSGHTHNETDSKKLATLDVSTGHTHNETDSKKLATLDVSTGHTHNETDSRKLATLDVSTGHTHNETDSRKLATLDVSTGHTHNGTDSKAPAVDNSTIEHSGTALRIKDDGVTGAKINSNVVDGTTIEQTGTTLNIKDGGVGANKLGTGATFNSAITRYCTIHAASFLPESDTTKWYVVSGISIGSSTTGASTFYAPVDLPDGAIVTNVLARWYREDALAAGTCSLKKWHISTGGSTMATVDSDSNSGAHSVSDSTISDASITHTNTSYYLEIVITPNDNAGDVGLYFVTITYTITAPLP